MTNKFQLLLFNKPMNVLSKFTDTEQRTNLSDYISVPRVYPVGRLDMNSEGLLLLTDNKRLVEPLLAPGEKEKTYLVCVEGLPTTEKIERLRTGVHLKDGPTLPAQVRVLDGPPDWLWEREPPIRFRKSIPVSWLELIISEGRNRQVRRMTAAVGLPILRLVRTGFCSLRLDAALPSGQWRVATNSERDVIMGLASRFDVKQRTRTRRRRK